MPAAELSRLQAQVQAISTQFNQPVDFIKSLLKLLDLYKDNNFHLGTVARMKSIIPTYHDPALVLNELEVNLADLTRQFPSPALQITDQLWKENYFETRWLAVVILGNIACPPVQPILDRLLIWIDPLEDNSLNNQCLSVGTRLLRKHCLNDWLSVVDAWLKDEDEEIKKIGLQAIQVIVSDPDFENFPLIYSALQPVVLDVGVATQKELFNTIEILAQRTPLETATFLHASLTQNKNQQMLILIRRCLPLFEKSIQESIKVDL